VTLRLVFGAVLMFRRQLGPQVPRPAFVATRVRAPANKALRVW